MAQPIPVPENLLEPKRQPGLVIPTDWAMTESDIVWMPRISWWKILLAALVFRDFNKIHLSAKAAKTLFGKEATGRVAHGNLILGYLSGIIAKAYPGLLVHEIGKQRIQTCFCSGDRPGFLLKEESRVSRMGLDIVHLSIQIYRKRPVRGGYDVSPVFRKTLLEVQLQGVAKT